MNPLALPLAETWDLAAIFDGPAAVAAARARLLESLPALAAGRGTLSRSGSDLAEALERAGEAYRIWSALHCYASCASDGDLRVAEQRALRQSIELLGTRVSEALSYLRPEILELPEGVVEAFLAAEPRLEPHAFFLRDLLRLRPHVLGAAEERILSQAGLLSPSAGALYNVLNNSELPRPEFALETGERLRLTPVAFHAARSTASVADRRRMFPVYFGAYGAFRDTLGQNLFNALKAHLFRARSRGYDSCLAAALDPGNVPVEVYRTLVREVRARRGLLHRYLELRAELLEIDRLEYPDLYGPLGPLPAPSFSPAAAQRLVSESLACAECLEWDPAVNAGWYEVRRCDANGTNCTLVGDTLWRNHGASISRVWCAAWDDPFPTYAHAYAYSVRACKDGASGPVCSSSFSNPIGYVTAPYMCIENGLEIACAASAPPPSLMSDLDGDGITDSVDPDDDADGMVDVIDNCPQTMNLGQRDADRDHVGDACDPQPLIPGSQPADADNDGVGDGVDLCPSIYDPAQLDADGDRTGDSCDNCPQAANQMQTDADDDGQGDRCDLDDGTIYDVFSTRTRLTWEQEFGYSAWCVYRGDLAELRRSRTYTQSPTSYPLAGRFCDLSGLTLDDTQNPPPGAATFYLVAGRPGPYPSELGVDSAGSTRPNTRPCP